jgi:hypothetical protein
VDASRYSVVMGWDLCVMVSCKLRGLQCREKKKNGGGGENTGIRSKSGKLQIFQVDFHHTLEHLCRFGIFGKSDVLQVGVEAL